MILNYMNTKKEKSWHCMPFSLHWTLILPTETLPVYHTKSVLVRWILRQDGLLSTHAGTHSVHIAIWSGLISILVRITISCTVQSGSEMLCTLRTKASPSSTADVVVHFVTAVRVRGQCFPGACLITCSQKSFGVNNLCPLFLLACNGCIQIYYSHW